MTGLQLINLSLYPATLVLCGLVGWYYYVGFCGNLRRHGWTKEGALRLGILIGFIVGAAAHMSVWGLARWMAWLGAAEAATDLGSWAVANAFIFRGAISIAAILHIYAATEKRSTMVAALVLTAAIFVTAAVYLTVDADGAALRLFIGTEPE